MKTALGGTTELWVEASGFEPVTCRQRDILRLILVGKTNREIGNILKISVRTVEVHRFNLMRKLNVRNVVQLLRRALDLGLISVSQELPRSRTDEERLDALL